jgi:cytochrome P450
MNNLTDIFSYDFSQNPFEFYEHLSKKGNVHYIEADNSWLVIGFSEIVDVLKNHHVFSSQKSQPFDPVLLNLDPPIHTANRKILQDKDGLLNKNIVDSYSNRISEICTELIGSLRDKNEFDIVNDFAVQYSISVIFDFLGFPKEQLKEVKYWSGNFILGFQSNKRKEALESWKRIEEIVKEWINKEINSFSNSRIKKLLLHPDATLKSVDEFTSYIKSLLIGGSETTPSLIASVIYHILKDNDSEYNIKQNRHLLLNYINEILRLESPVQMIGRTTKSTYKLGETVIPENSIVRVSLGAGNRDFKYFNNPNKIIFDRKEKKILSFGIGVHYCIGANLALNETYIAVNTLLNHFPKIRLKEGFSPKYRHSNISRSIEHLPILVS